MIGIARSDYNDSGGYSTENATKPGEGFDRIKSTVFYGIGPAPRVGFLLEKMLGPTGRVDEPRLEVNVRQGAVFNYYIIIG